MDTTEQPAIPAPASASQSAPAPLPAPAPISTARKSRRAPAPAPRADAEAAPAPPAKPDRATLLAQLERARAECEEVERLLGRRGVPELETIIKLHRVILLRFSLEAEVSPDMLKLIDVLMKPVMDWARLEEKRKDRELAEQKYRDQLEAEKTARTTEAADSAAETLKPETLEQIQDELSLL